MPTRFETPPTPTANHSETPGIYCRRPARYSQLSLHTRWVATDAHCCDGLLNPTLRTELHAPDAVLSSLADNPSITWALRRDDTCLHDPDCSPNATVDTMNQSP